GGAAGGWGRLAGARGRLAGARAGPACRWGGPFRGGPRRGEVFDDADKLKASAPPEPGEGGEPGAAGAGELARGRAEIKALRRMLELNRSLNATRDTGRLLPAILDAAVEGTGAWRGCLLLASGEGYGPSRSLTCWRGSLS